MCRLLKTSNILLSITLEVQNAIESANGNAVYNVLAVKWYLPTYKALPIGLILFSKY